MIEFLTRSPQSRRTLTFASAMHVFSDLCFALLVPLQLAMQKDLGLSYFQVGLLRTMFNGSTAVLQIPAGIMAESFGEFWLLVSGNAWVAVGLMGMALSPVFIVLLLAASIGGLGGGTQHPLGSSLVSRAYEDRGRSTAVGTVNFAGDLGKILAPLVALLAIPFGWRAVLWVVGIGGLLLMVLCIPLRRAVDIGKPPPRAQSGAPDAGDGGPLGAFVMLSVVGFLDSATRGASLVFLPFVMQDRGMGAGQISLMLVLLFSGGAFGKYAVGWLGDRFETVTLVWGTKGLTAVLLILSLVTPTLALAPLMVVLGAGLNGTSSALYAGVADLVPARRRARLYGCFYTTNEGGTVLAPLIYGVIADVFSLNLAVLLMGMVTLLILPVSLTLRRHLSPAARGA